MIYIYTESSLLQLEEARQDKLLDVNYSRVDIDNMVQDLDIARDSKRKLKSSLNKYKTLFGRGLGKLDIEPVDFKIHSGQKPYAETYYNVVISI